jgi:hypothetical protein
LQQTPAGPAGVLLTLKTGKTRFGVALSASKGIFTLPDMAKWHF